MAETVEEKIFRYKKYLEKFQHDKSQEKEVSRILKKLDELPVTLEHLVNTVIGKTVNSYKKHEGVLGSRAKTLISKWRRLVPVVKVEPTSTTIQCETISETSYNAPRVKPERNSPSPNSHRVPYMQSTRGHRTQSCDSLEDEVESLGSRSSEGGANQKCDIISEEVNCDKADCDNSDNPEDNIVNVKHSKSGSSYNKYDGHGKSREKNSHKERSSLEKDSHKSSSSKEKEHDKKHKKHESRKGHSSSSTKNKESGHSSKTSKKDEYVGKESCSKEFGDSKETLSSKHLVNSVKDGRSSHVSQSISYGSKEPSKSSSKENRSKEHSKNSEKESSKNSEKERSKEHSKNSEKERSKEHSQNSEKVRSKEHAKNSEKERSKEYSKNSEKERPKEHSKNSEKERSKEHSKNSEKERSKEHLKNSEKERSKEHSKNSEKERSKEHLKKSEKERSKDHSKNSETGRSNHNSKNSEKESRSKDHSSIMESTSKDRSKHSSLESRSKDHSGIKGSNCVKRESTPKDHSRTQPTDRSSGKNAKSNHDSTKQHEEKYQVCQELGSPEQLDAFSEKLKLFTDRIKKQHDDSDSNQFPEFADIVNGEKPALDGMCSPPSDSANNDVYSQLGEQPGYSPTSLDRVNNIMLRDMRSDDGWSKRSEKKHRTPREDSGKVGTSKRKSDVNLAGSSHKKVRISDVQKSPIDDDDANDGLSFEDFMNCDQHLLKKHNHKKKLTSASSLSATKSDETNVRQHKSDTKSSKSDNHSKKSSVDKESHHKRASSSSSRHSSSHHKASKETKRSRSSKDHGDGDDVKRKNTKIDVPVASAKQMKLTEVDIMADLPDTNPNYHPLPYLKPEDRDKHNQAVDDDFLGTKRNTRTQVYSGRKVSSLQEVPRLYDACMRVLMDNIDSIESVGGVPFDILKPLLEKCSSSQLYTIEEFNPQFIGETEALWQKLCNKDFRTAKPDEFEYWRELYLRKHDEREARLKRLTTNISVSFAKKQEPVKKTKLAYVDSFVKPPRSVMRQQRRHGTAGPMVQQDPLARLTSHGANPVKGPIHRNHMNPAPHTQSKHSKIASPMMQKSMKLFKNLKR